MCGITGIITGKKSSLGPKKIGMIVKKLLIASQSRGMEATGIALMIPDRIDVLKQSLPARKFTISQQYQELFGNISQNDKPIAIIGHTRLATDGDNTPENNQPIIKNGIIGVHNGIIVNDDVLWKKHRDLHQKFQVDTEVLLSIIKKYLNENLDLPRAIKKVFGEIEGSVSTALLFDNLGAMILATNNGSLYYCHDKLHQIFVFASERRILLNLKLNLCGRIEQVLPNTAYIVDINSCTKYRIHLDKKIVLKIKPTILRHPRRIVDYTRPLHNQPKIIQYVPDHQTLKKIDKTLEKIKKLRRCTRCILPETMPYIEFDDKGVCNYCRGYISQNGKIGQKELSKILKPHHDKNHPDCLLTFSGGRDSSYGLHFLKKELGLNPLAYTYDWGMVTDLGRRNQARMVGSLGVEQIWVSADIPLKRTNIRKNVLAWLKKPDLGTVPLFMAGDKQYFYYANKIAKANKIKNIIICLNPLEKTDFKYGFCNIKPDKDIYYRLSAIDKAKLAGYYGKQYVANPAFINSSLIDSISAFVSYYFIPHDYISLYEYIKWDENKINKTLLGKYNWETATDTKNTWRIGDGTASFYNFIYLMLAGFTENDTFRSNQIREGAISRQEALRLAERDNTPRYDSIKWYCKTIGIDFGPMIDRIIESPKLY